MRNKRVSYTFRNDVDDDQSPREIVPMNVPTPNSIRRQLDQTSGFSERQRLLKQLWLLERRRTGKASENGEHAGRDNGQDRRQSA